MRADDREALIEALNDPKLSRILAVLLEAVQQRGQPPVRLKIANEDEADALQSIVGGKPIRSKSIETAELERRMQQNSRFKCSIRQLLEIRFGKIVSRREARSQTDADWSEGLARLQEVACRNAPADLCKRVFRWIEADRKLFRRRFTRQGSATLEHDLRVVIRALARLPEQGRIVLLAQLAEEASHDPHAFDAGQSAGSLLDQALSHWFPQENAGRKGTARWRRRLLARAGIQRDSISSRVDTFGVLIDASASPAPTTLGLDRTWTLRALMRVRGSLRAAEGVAWVVENPTVFEALLDRLEGLDRDFDPTLVCTNGRLNVADEVLLDALMQNGARVLYSGDFDADGVQIALDVRDRHPERVQFWRMAPTDYRDALRESSPNLRWKGLPRARAALPELVAAMCTDGRVAYQESLIETLFSDIARFTRTRTVANSPARQR